MTVQTTPRPASKRQRGQAAGCSASPPRLRTQRRGHERSPRGSSGSPVDLPDPRVRRRPAHHLVLPRLRAAPTRPSARWLATLRRLRRLRAPARRGLAGRHSVVASCCYRRPASPSVSVRSLACVAVVADGWCCRAAPGQALFAPGCAWPPLRSWLLRTTTGNGVNRCAGTGNSFVAHPGTGDEPPSAPELTAVRRRVPSTWYTESLQRNPPSGCSSKSNPKHPRERCSECPMVSPRPSGRRGVGPLPLGSTWWSRAGRA